MPSIRKLASGSWNARKMIDGHSYSVTFDHKPTQKEIDNAFYDLRKDAGAFKGRGTFNDYALQYLKDKSNVLSSTTVKNYKSVLRNLSPAFLSLKFAQISQVDIQREINNYSIGRSPKTVKNASGFITVVMWYFRPDMQIKTKLPQSVKAETYIPTDDEVRAVLSAAQDTPYFVPLWLCACGLRKSEALAVTAEKITTIDGRNFLTINEALVVSEDNTYQLKTTKTVSSTRTIWIPEELARRIKSQGAAYTGFPGNLLRALHRFQDSLNINRCKLHALRHYYVSAAHAAGVPDATIAHTVGHANIATTQAIYTHAQRDKQTSYEETVGNIIFGTILE